MNKEVTKKINTSNKIFPIFYGLSSDLIFFIAINTLFLTEVKGLTSSEINFTTMIGTFVAQIFYLTSHKIIKKIGNMKSVKLGTILILVSALLFTFSKSLPFFVLAEVLYEVSFVFLCVDTVVLSNNLAYQKKDDEFIKIKNKASMIYSVATLIASAVAGILFNINPYIPMIICILICLNNFIMSHFIYEIETKEKEEKKLNKKFDINKIILITIIIYGLIYGTITVCQTNDKLFMQYRLKDFLSLNNVAITMSAILFLSRISRLLSNIFFNKIYSKIKNNMLYLINIILIASVLLFIIGKIIKSPLVGSILMATGFIMLLTLRDPTENVLSTILMQNTKKEDKEKAMLYFQFARRLTVFLLSMLATMILKKYELFDLYIIIFIFTLLYLIIINKLKKLIKE